VAAGARVTQRHGVGDPLAMLTWTGKQVYPMRLTVMDVEIIDIAHALARQCRFNGHCDGYISVANHCVRVSEILQRSGCSVYDQRWGLLHDAAEAYLGDVITPMKRSGMFEVYYAAEQLAEAAIAEKFGLSFPMPACIKDADTVAVKHEMDELWSFAATPGDDEALYLARFKELFQ